MKISKMLIILKVEISDLRIHIGILLFSLDEMVNLAYNLSERSRKA